LLALNRRIDLIKAGTLLAPCEKAEYGAFNGTPLWVTSVKVDVIRAPS
jgi:hypothetical protein